MMRIFDITITFILVCLSIKTREKISLSISLFICCFFLLSTVFSVSAATFTSVQNGSWNAASTWNQNRAPDINDWPNDKVIINHIVTKPGNLTMNGSTSNIIISNGGSLSVTGTFYVGSGKIHMESGSILSGNVIQLNTSGNKEINGIITSTSNMEIDGHFTGSPTIICGGSLLLGAQNKNQLFGDLDMQVAGNMTVQNVKLTWTSGNVIVGGNFLLKGTGDVDVPDSGNLTVSGTLSVNNLLSIDGPIGSGTGGIVSWGSGDVILSGNNQGLNNCPLPYLSPFDLSACAITGSAIDWRWIGNNQAIVDNYTQAFEVDGAPKNLIDISSRLDADLLTDFYGMVPEGVEVSASLLNSSFSSISVKDDLAAGSAVTVKVTFLNEGAGYKNSLGYFIYQKDTPPTSIEDIEHIIIMPNTSKTYSGGSLNSGDQLDLMIELTAGQSIGFFINSNGWDGTRGKQKSSFLYDQPFYTLESLNPTVGLGQRYHVIFNDTRSSTESGSGFFAFGFEDILTSTGDKDYNDLIFNVEVTPISAVENYQEATVIESVNSQVNKKKGVLAFEDNWPLIDDYDFNDAVIAYDITTTLDGDNNNDSVKSITLIYQIQAIGASFHNGLAVRVPGLSESMIETVTLEKTLNSSTNVIGVGSQVTTQLGSGEFVTYDYPLIKDSEFGDSSVSFTLSEDLFEELSTFDGDAMVFATPSCMYKTTLSSAQCPASATSATLKLTIDLKANTLLSTSLGSMPFDHYLFGTHKNNLYPYSRKNSDSDWFSAWKTHFYNHVASQGPGPGKYLEIHLKEFQTGTNVFEKDFSLSDFSGALSIDAKNHSIGNPFISETGNLPWVLDLPENWRHPKERADISQAYPNFYNWAVNNETHTDWYNNNVNENKLYIE
jgi:LruC domain-containing protein